MTYLRADRRPRMRWIATAALLASLAGLVLSQVGPADAAGAATLAAVTRPIVAAAAAPDDPALLDEKVASWTRGRRSINEIGIELLYHWFLPQRSAPLAIIVSEVLGVVPLEITDALLDEFHRLADHHERGFLVEQVMELLATS